MTRQRIAIIGGGPGGLSTAFHLTNQPDWQSRYSITVYQLGWRLGGKGATGRDASRGWRIEEHGIHGFCKFYFNTWPMMARAYDELEPAARALLPCKTVQDAFLPTSLTYSVDYDDGWHTSTAHLPHGGGNPWDPGDVELSWKAVLLALFDQMLSRNRPGNPKQLSHKDLLHPVQDKKVTLKHDHPGKLIHKLIKGFADHIKDDWEDADDNGKARLLKKIEKDIAKVRGGLGGLFKTVDRIFHLGHSDTLTNLDLYLSLLLGIIRDELWRTDIDSIDHLDYRTWLEQNGASTHTLNSSAVLAIGNILFAYPHGDSTHPPALSAASWLNWTLRSVLGKGAYFYFMAAGTGDTAILPLYLLLKQRGVKFEFFHKLVGTESSGPADARTLETLVFERQAKTIAGDYTPLVTLPNSGGAQVWPNHPDWSQLARGKDNSSNGVNYESWSQEPAPGSAKRALRRGATGVNGFDYAVWAMPTSMIPLIADDLLSQQWAHVVKQLPTTMTQAAQFWLDKDTSELGWPIPSGDPPTTRYASASFPNPLNGMTVFTDLIGYERWGRNPPKGLVYLCAQLQPTANTHAQDLARVRANVAASMRQMGDFLPGARQTGLARNDPQAMDFGLLHDPDPKNTGVARLDFQYVRANTDPVEGYVQAIPGGVTGRLFPWKSGYSNLVPAGDWIYSGFNIGAFESAISGGKIAAFALAGDFDVDEVRGFGFLHPVAEAAARDAVAKGLVPVIK